MKLSKVLFVALSIVFLACKGTNDPGMPPKSKANAVKLTEKIATNETYQVDADEISKDFMTWYKYTYANIRLEQNFTGLDTKGMKVDKQTFLHRLAGGGFLAIKTAKKEGVPVYQLYRQQRQRPDIQTTIVQMAQTALTLVAMEGNELPDYNFTDLNGRSYDKKSTRGKVLLLKCWFINCVACVKEFPLLNRLVERYKNRNDVQFISLASDGKKDLLAFLGKKPFSYAVVPEVGEYMQEKLNVNAYPLHLLIDENGRIVKATNSIDDLIPSLEIKLK